MKSQKTAAPFKWPFPAAPKAQAQKPAPRDSKRAVPLPGSLSRKGMVADVVMVIFWAASIPGLMWLGVAGGF